MPHQVYRNAAGKRVPSVTTILGKYKDPEPLVKWANRLGLEGKNCLEVRQAAASAGTVAHELIDANLKNREPKLPTEEDLKSDAFAYQEIMQRAERSYDNFLAWRAKVNLEVVATELALVSEEFQYGGCVDAIIRVNGYLLVGDWKTSRNVYPEYLMQVAAYWRLWLEKNPEEKPDGAKLLRIDRETAEWHQHTWIPEQVTPALDSFLHRLSAYRADYHTRKAFKAGRHVAGLAA